MGYLGTPPQSGFITTAKQRVTSSTNNYVDLDHSISSIADVIVFVNFVKQDTTNLTLTTSTRITLGGTLVSSDVVEIHYLGKAVNTQTPSAGTVTSDMLAGSIANSKLANSSITLNGSAVSLGGSATISSNAGTEIVYADRSGNQSPIADNVDTKVTFDTEFFDSDNCYDNSSNYRFTPNVAGKYFVYASTRADEGTDDLYKIQNGIKKNGSQATGIGQTSWDGRNGKGTDASTYSGGIIDMNGSSDYLEVHVQVDSVSGSNSALKNVGTYFGAYKIIE